MAKCALRNLLYLPSGDTFERSDWLEVMWYALSVGKAERQRKEEWYLTCLWHYQIVDSFYHHGCCYIVCKLLTTTCIYTHKSEDVALPYIMHYGCDHTFCHIDYLYTFIMEAVDTRPLSLAPLIAPHHSSTNVVKILGIKSWLECTLDIWLLT